MFGFQFEMDDLWKGVVLDVGGDSRLDQVSPTPADNQQVALLLITIHIMLMLIDCTTLISRCRKIIIDKC